MRVQGGGVALSRERKGRVKGGRERERAGGREGGRERGRARARENTVSSSNVHTREVIMIVCVSIIPGPLRVKVPSPSLPNLSLELAVADLSSLKVKETSKRRERGREGGREGEGERGRE